MISNQANFTVHVFFEDIDRFSYFVLDRSLLFILLFLVGFRVRLCVYGRFRFHVRLSGCGFRVILWCLSIVWSLIMVDLCAWSCYRMV